MASFHHSQELSEKIKFVLGGQNVRCAVAFLGWGAEELLPEGATVVCNLKMGGTNPNVVRKLQGKCNVGQHDTLHAKVYISTRGAVVASANLSANGLGLQGREQDGWMEAGFFTTDTADISSWLDALNIRPITEVDLSKAMEAWIRRTRPSVPGLAFMDLKVAQEECLLLWWSSNPGGEIDYGRVSAKTGIDVRSAVDNNSFDVSNEEDAEFLRNKHILLFQNPSFSRRRDQTKVGSTGWFWRTASIEVKSGFKDNSLPEGGSNSVRPLWLGDTPKRNEPIMLSTEDRKILSEVMNEESYRFLWADDWRPYFTKERRSLILRFWHDVYLRVRHADKRISL